LRSVVHVAVGVLVALLVTSAAVTGVARAAVAGAQRTLDERILPARQATSDLATAYVDQETGHRGFLLTGDAGFLEPYDDGVAVAGELHGKLADLLSGDDEGLALLRSVEEAGDVWRTTVAEPGNAARGGGPLPEAEATSLATEGRARFDALRGRLDDLATHSDELLAAQLAGIRDAQVIANVVAISAAGLAVAVGLGTWLFLRRRLDRPLRRLLADVQTVADGDYDHPIDRSGPRELALIGGAVDRMRASVVASGRERLAAERELTLRQEHDRLAADLHDLTIQRVFGLGLSLTSVARRQPQVAGLMTPLVTETDRIIRELRTVIFGLTRGGSAAGGTLRGRLMDVVEASVPALGFAPSITFSGPIDTLVPESTAIEILAAARESLSNVARHAHAAHVDVSVQVSGEFVELTVADDGDGLPSSLSPGSGLADVSARARRLGGDATIGAGADGCGAVVTWRAPVPGP
jgi:signal transduction histidine kinase